MKVGKQLRHNLPMLKMIHEARDETKRNAAKCCSRELCEAMSEIARNMLKGNIPLSEAQYTTLRRYVQDMEKLADKRSSLKTKRNVIQKGGFIGALLGPALKVLLPAVGSIASSIFPALTGGRR